MSEYLDKLGAAGLFWFLLPSAWGVLTLYRAASDGSIGLAVSGAGFILFGAGTAFRVTPPGLGSMSHSSRELLRLVLLALGVLLMVVGGQVK